MMDLILGNPHIMTATARPKWTAWLSATVAKTKKLHRRTRRRQYKQYMITGRIEDFNRSQKLLTRRDFD